MQLTMLFLNMSCTSPRFVEMIMNFMTTLWALAGLPESQIASSITWLEINNKHIDVNLV